MMTAMTIFMRRGWVYYFLSTDVAQSARILQPTRGDAPELDVYGVRRYILVLYGVLRVEVVHPYVLEDRSPPSAATQWKRL